MAFSPSTGRARRGTKEASGGRKNTKGYIKDIAVTFSYRPSNLASLHARSAISAKHYRARPVHVRLISSSIPLYETHVCIPRYKYMEGRVRFVCCVLNVCVAKAVEKGAGKARGVWADFLEMIARLQIMRRSIYAYN